MHQKDPLPAILGHTDIYVIDQVMRGRIAPPMRILDAGLGSGRNVRYFLKAGYPVMGLEPNPEALEGVRALARRLQPTLPEENFRAETLEAHTFPDGCADVILCNAVLHFAHSREHWEAMVEGAWRALAPGGLWFARLASNIGIEDQVQPLGDGRFGLPDGSERYLVDAATLKATTAAWGGSLLDPIKTTVVDGLRSMTTWVVRKAE